MRKVEVGQKYRVNNPYYTYFTRRSIKLTTDFVIEIMDTERPISELKAKIINMSEGNREIAGNREEVYLDRETLEDYFKLIKENSKVRRVE